MRKSFCFDVNIVVHTLTETVFKLDLLFELLKADELNQTKDSVPFDGCSCNNRYFICVPASYYTEVIMEIVQRLKHLALSTMSNADGDQKQSENCDGATTVNAQSRLQFFTGIFCFFGQNFSPRCLCLIGDNCARHLKVADISNKPYIGFCNHKLNLEVNAIGDEHTEHAKTIDSAHKTVVSAKKLKKVAWLQSLTDLSPAIHNATRWSDKSYMLQHFANIKDALRDVKHAENVDLEMDASLCLFSKEKESFP